MVLTRIDNGSHPHQQWFLVASIMILTRIDNGSQSHRQWFSLADAAPMRMITIRSCAASNRCLSPDHYRQCQGNFMVDRTATLWQAQIRMILFRLAMRPARGWHAVLAIDRADECLYRPNC